MHAYRFDSSKRLLLVDGIEELQQRFVGAQKLCNHGPMC